jgi:hypothetical protein
MSGNEEARTQREALHDSAGRRPTEKSLQADAAMRLLLAAAMRKEQSGTGHKPGSTEHGGHDGYPGQG